MDVKFEPGELFVYTNGDRWELGMVKRPGNGDGYFCWYSRGDTAAYTTTSCMHKLANAGYTHIEQMLDDTKTEQDKWDDYIEDHDGVLEWHSPRLHPPKAIELHFADGIARFVPERTCHALPQKSNTDCIVIRNGFSRHFGYWKCSECGVECFEGAKYCMDCGARRVTE